MGRSSTLLGVIWLTVWLASATESPVSATESPASAAESLTYEQHVRPILKAHCFHCHGEGGITEGSLDLRLRRFLVAGGDSGAAIEPGDPDASLLLERIESGEMPPEDKRVPEAEVDLLRQWIAQGANTAREEPLSLEDGEYFTEEERSFWSFQPIRRPTPPRIDDAAVVNPIDAFVLERLRREGLSFSQRADRSTLIRRATFDLWGLPPTPEMVEAFIADDRPGAYERLIDRLLSSPQYGERWGRHWLDVAGYADSDGYTNEDTVREFAYFYRDYVIDSFNADKPLDQFICEQLAGDEMDGGVDLSKELDRRRIEQLAATGFLRMAPDGTAAGGVNRAEAANETIADTINIVTTSLLGLTVGCARCHDHRYDPISQADYYRFRAIFEPALDWKQWKLPRDRRVSLYTAEQKRQRDEVERRAKEAEAARTRRQQEHIARTLYEELLVVPDDKRDALKTAFETEKAKRSPEQVALLEEYPSVGNISNGSLYLYAEQRARRAGDIEKAAAEREARYLEQARERRLAAVAEETRAALEQLVTTPRESWDEDQQRLAEAHPHVFVSADDLREILPEAFAELERYREAARICRQQDAKTELAEMAKEIAAIRASAPQEHFVRVLTEPAGHTPPTHLFIRGDHNQPGTQLPPEELTVLRSDRPAAIPENDPSLPTSGRRLAYARHLTSGEHPLVARVLINRVWLHHFGRGIVETPGDFGYLGAPPTHPELLDWLADELMRGGWQLKRMHRLIMLSHTYQQQSLRTEQLDRVDPDNRLLARMSVRRLESEAVRDAMLAASGELLNQLHGPPVPVREDAVGQIIIGQEMLDGERKPTGDAAYFDGVCRRSIYVQVRRSRPLAVLETFDIASVAPNCTIRNASNVATQGLMMMNSQFAMDRANRLAGFVIESRNELDEQLSLAWLRCYARPIDAGMLEAMKDFVGQQASLFRSRDQTLADDAAQRLAVASACQVMLSSNEFLYVD